MDLSSKLWQKIIDSFHFKKIKQKPPQKYRKTYPSEEEALDMNIDQAAIALWSRQNLDILQWLSQDGFALIRLQ